MTRVPTIPHLTIHVMANCGLVAVAVAAGLVVGGVAYATEHREADRPMRVGGLDTATGVSAVHGAGPVRRFAVEVDRRLGVPAEEFAADVEGILFDRRGWLGTGSKVSLQRVDRPPYNFRVTLAAPDLVDRLCKPFRTGGRVSCENRGRAVINANRWLFSTSAWPRRVDYRRYLINHEAGHSLGHPHRSCPRAGGLAPVMQQQTGGAGACRRGQWPKAFERRRTRAPGRQYEADARG